MRRSALLFCGLLAALPARADDAPARAGWLVTPNAFQSVLLPPSFANDKLRDALGYAETGPVRAYDHDLDDDGRPERFVVGAEKLCGADGCPFALLDGKTQKEIGAFTGTLIVLERREDGWALVQTLGKADDEGLTPLTTYAFQWTQYRPGDATLLDEAALDALFATLGRKP